MPDSKVDIALRYRGSFGRLDVGWDESQRDLGVIFFYEGTDLPRLERHVNFEPYMQYATDGTVSPIMLQVRNGMRTSEPERVVLTRGELLEGGFLQLLQRVAEN